LEPVHRDDIPMEAMEEIEKFIQDKFPGMKVICAGDTPGELPEELREQMQEIEAAFAHSMLHGLCIDCGAKMEGYEQITEKDDWAPTAGWRYFTNVATGEPQGWQCPECDRKEQEEQGFGKFTPFGEGD
jgi:roadblock/LC7 domain-containing protein